MNFVVSAMLAWMIILTYEAYQMNKDNDKMWEIIMNLSKTLRQNIELFEDEGDKDE